ncbi:MBL fold metallo-hydrolase [soil metagenome]|nr:MBL fold metallo-hydrolase [Acidobacteriota bacterium]
MTVNRREFLYLSTAAIAALPLRSVSGALLQPQAPATRFETIRRNVGYFTGRGGTIGWLVNPDAVAVVDSQYPNTATICLDGLKEKSTRGVDLLFNTHHHGDHIGGNEVFRPATKRLVTHARVPELATASAKGADAAPLKPDVTFDKTWSESAGDERITATHHGPAHTGGDAVIYFERANVAHMGDLLFHQMHPFVDRAGGASMQNWITTLQAVTKDLPADALYIAGHARQGQPVVVTSKDVLRLRDYFDGVLSHTRAGLAQKRSKEEISTLESLKGFEEYAGSGTLLSLASVVGVAYEELTAAK